MSAVNSTDRFEKSRRALKRLLANGPLTAVPKRPSDQQLVLDLAATRFEAGRNYDEGEVNELLKTWLESISVPFGIDHVTMRRLMVDSRLLLRTSSGSTYRLDPQRIGEIDAVRALDPAGVLAEMQSDRDQRKRQRETRSSSVT